MKRTLNRKYSSHASTITHDGYQYGVLPARDGFYPQQLHAIIKQLDICEEKWKRVLMVRFDLHQKNFTDSSLMITRFRKSLARRIDRQYEGISQMGYTWARELEEVSNQHYHCALFLDGNRIKYPKLLNQIISDTWKNVEINNTIHHPRNCFYFINNQNIKALAVKRLSYLAKTKSKGARPPQAKDYGTSRLRPPLKKQTTNRQPHG